MISWLPCTVMCQAHALWLLCLLFCSVKGPSSAFLQATRNAHHTALTTHSGFRHCDFIDSDGRQHPHRLLPAAVFDFCCALPLFWLSAFCLIFKDRMRMLVGSVDTTWSSTAKRHRASHF